MKYPWYIIILYVLLSEPIWSQAVEGRNEWTHQQWLERYALLNADYRKKPLDVMINIQLSDYYADTLYP
ncbi:MAG: hypothetical protein KBT04_05575, partial [Bacteroidales bacterium]|nr:hypothetical protein [Candidatus Colimorpha onthohippi]